MSIGPENIQNMDIREKGKRRNVEVMNDKKKKEEK